MLGDFTLAEIARKNAGINPELQDARPPGNATATGSITTIAEADLVDGETFTLDDGIHDAVVFEFDKAGDGVTAGNVEIELAGGETADEVRDLVIAAINGVDSSVFSIFAESGGAASVDLTNEFGGAHGNTSSAETVANASFIVTHMSGGVDYPTTYPTNNGDGTDALDASRAVVIVKPKDGSSVTFDIVSRTQGRDDEWEPLHNLTDLTAETDRGFKELINCSPEAELALHIKEGDATLVLIDALIGPCTG